MLEREVQLKQTHLGQLAARLGLAVGRRVTLATSHARLPELTNRMSEALNRTVRRSGERLPELTKRLSEAFARDLRQRQERLQRLEQLRVSLNPDRPLDLGFARVNRPDGVLIKSPAGVANGEALILTFKGDQTLDVIAGSGGTPPPARATPKPAPSRPKPPAPDQGSLF